MKKQKDDYNPKEGIGKQGLESEEVFMYWLDASPEAISCIGEVVRIDDVRHDEDFMARDVDFVLTTASGVFWFDVKQDTYINATRNMCFEASCKKNGRVWPAWGGKSKAGAIVFHNPQTSTMYLIPLEQFRQAVAQYVIDEQWNVNWTQTNTIEGKQMLNILLPEKYWKPITYTYDCGQ